MPHSWNILGLSDYEIKDIEGQNQMIDLAPIIRTHGAK